MLHNNFMNQISKVAENAILKLESAVDWVVTTTASVAFAAAVIQSAYWIRDQVYVGARMESADYVSKVRAACRRSDGCLAANVTYSHLWAADSSRIFKLGTHMSVDVQAMPNAYERSIAALLNQIPEADRQFVRITHPGNLSNSTK
jgi:hypothetical protein